MKLRLFIKSIRYSFNLLYRSGGVLLFVYLLFSLLCATVPLLSAYILKNILDILSGTSSQENTLIALIFSIALYVGMILLSYSLSSFKDICYQSIYNKACHTYNCEMLNKLSEMPISILDTSEGRDMVDEIGYIDETAVSLIFKLIDVISLVYTFTVAFVALISFNVWFSLLFIVLTLPGTIIDWVFGRKIIEFRQKTAPDVRKFRYYRWMLVDAWPAKDVRMYDLTDHIRKRYDEEKSEYQKANKELDKKELWASLFSEVIKRSGEIAFTVYVIYRAVLGTITIGDVSLFIGFALTISASFESILRTAVIEYGDNTELFKTVFDFYAVKENKTKPCRTIISFESLTFENVYFKYPCTEKYILSGVSFTLNKGDKLSIVGINGSGKSTIIKLILGLYEIDSGRILINGYPMQEYDPADISAHFSALFQTFVQYPLTLRENIALSSYDRMENSEAIRNALIQSGVYNEIQDKLKNGLDSYMTRQFDDQGTELSKGQWQKIALSRAYFKNADVLIFDEPSAALDAEAEDLIFKNFEDISEGKTGIMISHRISAARMTNKIIVLDGGVIRECGTHDELIALGGLYAKLYNLQKEKYTAKEGV